MAIGNKQIATVTLVRSAEIKAQSKANCWSHCLILLRHRPPDEFGRVMGLFIRFGQLTVTNNAQSIGFSVVLAYNLLLTHFKYRPVPCRSQVLLTKGSTLDVNISLRDIIKSARRVSSKSRAMTENGRLEFKVGHN